MKIKVLYKDGDFHELDVVSVEIQESDLVFVGVNVDNNLIIVDKKN